ncbi:MAG: hypothetical protein HYR58_07200 [Acidobacteria bacterium]|nr:hypothetical protein [Acidobacteriota bacterium]MBI3484544.1 hypothetical protein [Acidobacteriota bacterium]
MRATRRRAASASRRSAARKAKLKRSVKPAVRPPAPLPAMVMYRVCKPGWAVLVEKQANALGTRFVCPFCPVSHRVPGPVRGFRKLRRAQWIKLRRVGE